MVSGVGLSMWPRISNCRATPTLCAHRRKRNSVRCTFARIRRRSEVGFTAVLGSMASDRAKFSPAIADGLRGQGRTAPLGEILQVEVRFRACADVPGSFHGEYQGGHAND